MSTTTYFEGSATLMYNGRPKIRPHDDELLKRYERLVKEQRHSWTEHHHLNKLLGSGGQGVVYLSERRGTDKFTLPVALKVF